MPPSPIPPNTALTSYTPSQNLAFKSVNMGVSINITKVDLSGQGHKKRRSVRGVGVRAVGPVMKLRRDVDILMASPDKE